MEFAGLWTLEESTGCGNSSCLNHNRPIAFHRDQYRRRGQTRSRNGSYFQCKACGRKNLLSNPVRIHASNQRLAADVFGRIANKSPVRCTVRGSGCSGPSAYYRILDFIVSRCRAHSGSIDRALIDGWLSLPKRMVVQSDAQEYTLNWVSRLDRRNVVLSSYCTVDAKSGFILGMHANFDGSVNPFDVNVDAASIGDMELAEPFRKYPQYWLTGDEIRAGRAIHRRLHKHDVVALKRQIAAIYASAESREDVEDIELQLHDDLHFRTPTLGQGMQVHLPYTIYGHWMLLHRMLCKAGVTQLQANMDINSTSRAAFLCAFTDEVKRGDAHGFYVRYTKYQSIDERMMIVREARKAMGRFASALPEEIRDDKEEVARRMMKERIDASQSYGMWNDEWVDHPIPTMNEPHKAVAWLTANDSIDEERKAEMFLDAGLARIDNVFMKTRRLFSALERPIGTSSGHNRVWHGYAPYNPHILAKYLTIFRSTHNFVFAGRDGRTPAMRLGFAKQPLRYEDVLWPGERIPKPKRSRRKGRILPIAQ